MKLSKLIREHKKALEAEAVRLYREVLKHRGNTQYTLYLDEDGTIDNLEDVQGGHSYWPDRDSVYTVSCPFFDPWEHWDEPKPEDEAEAKAMEAEIIDYLVDEYESLVSDIFDDVIKQTRYEEQMDEEY